MHIRVLTKREPVLANSFTGFLDIVSYFVSVLTQISALITSIQNKNEPSTDS